MKVKKGDKVIVLSGKNKGSEGIILATNKESNKVIVQGINLVKKHQKASGENPGGVIEMESAIDASNVALIDPKTKKATRIKMSNNKDNKKIRVAVKSNSELA